MVVSGGSLNPYERRECRPTMLWDVGGHREGAAGDDDDSKPSSPDKRQQQQQQDQASSKDVRNIDVCQRPAKSCIGKNVEN